MSLLRHMLQVKTQKTHCKLESKKEYKDMACYIRLQEEDEMVESGEFAETQVQRLPDQTAIRILLAYLKRTFQETGSWLERFTKRQKPFSYTFMRSWHSAQVVLV